MAKKTTIGARIELEGEREFKKAVGDIDAQLRVMKASLGQTAAQFEGQEKSVDALTAKHKTLGKQYELQAAKVDQMRGMLDKARAAFGENSRETAKWQEKLIKAETDLQKTENALRQASDALDDTNEHALKLGDALDSLAGKFGLNLPDNMRETLNGMVNLDAGSVALLGGFTALVTAITKVEKALINLTKEQAAVADELLTTSAITGLSTQTLQEYAYASELVDVSVDTVTSSLTKLVRSMGDAQQGTQAQVDAFARLGVAIEDDNGRLRDSEDVFNDVIDALGQMSNETERDAVAMELLGRSAMELNPLIKTGSQRMKELAAEAKEVGYVLSKDDLDALGAVDDAMQKLNNTVDTAKKRIAVEFAPSLEKALTALDSLTARLGKTITNSGIVKAFGMLLETIVDIVAPADRLSSDSIPALTLALKPLAQVLAGIADTLDFLNSVLHFDFKGMGQALGFGYGKGNPNNTQALQDYYYQLATNSATQAAGYGSYYADGKWYDYSRYQEIQAEKERMRSQYEHNYAIDPNIYKGMSFDEYWSEYAARNGYNAGGTTNWRGGMTWVGENGPERVYLPSGSQVLTAQESREVGGDTIIYMTINASDIQQINDLIEMVETERIRSRAERG